MKIRQGFVSNSSSSSFIIVGVEVPYDEFLADTMYENNAGVVDGEADKIYVGEVLEQEERLEGGQIDLEVATENAKRIVKEAGLDPDKIKIHWGTRAC